MRCRSRLCAAALLSLLAACAPLKSAFECSSSAMCVDTTAGVCEPSGFCSFADGSCASGRRYGRFAGQGLGGECVAAGGGSDGGTDDAGGDGGSVTFTGCANGLGGGGAHACAILSDGSAACWGAGASGQLGSGGLADQPLPSLVLDAQAMPLAAASLALGSAHSCAVSPAQTIACWGANDRGQLGTGASPSPQPVPALLGINPVVHAAAGDAHGCAAVGAARLVWCWGDNDDGQLSDGISGDSDQPRAALAKDGTQLAGIAALAAGSAHSCALADSGHVVCWGRNAEGQLGSGNSAPATAPVDVNGLGRVNVLAAGGTRSCAIVDGGGVWCWGAGQPVPTVVGGVTAAAVAVGPAHACVARADGGAACWGKNDHGQLGDGTMVDRPQPVAVLAPGGEPLGGVVDVVVGAAYSCARTAGGAVLCWGDGVTLGDGSGADRPRAGLVRLTCP